MNVIFRPVAPLVGAHFSSELSRSTMAGACLSIFIPLTVWAQPADRDPMNVQKVAPPIIYQSAFSDYKPYQDPEWVSWKTANDVVREFGSMAAMGNMGDAKTPGNTEATSETDHPKPPAQPAHDMSKMAPQAPASASQKPVTPTGKPVEKQTMPGHDMSKMPPAPTAPTTKSSPPPGKPAAPATMPGMSH